MKKKSAIVGEEILRIVAASYLMALKDVVAKLESPPNTLKDYFPLALLLHGGYLETNGSGSSAPAPGLSAENAQAEASFLWLWHTEDRERERRLDRLEVSVTAKGLLKLEELDRIEEARRVKRWDYFVTAGAAILGAVLAGLLA
jgi:hypothetical protein